MTQPEECIFCVDMGTTRTRVWLVVGGQIRERKAADFGVRDRRAAQHSNTIEEKFCGLLAETAARAEFAPSRIVAAGMIGSPSGLCAVAHVPAPAGLAELASNVQMLRIPSVSPLPIFVVPGVRTEADGHSIEDIESGDLMRGEESLCMGLLASGRLRRGDALLNLGSHWKWIAIDSERRIARSRTSLTGELIHAVQANTLLATALPQYRPERLDGEWLQRGAKMAKAEGLTRALFCVRLLEQAQTGTAEDRLSYLYGAVLESEASAVANSQFFRGVRNVLIAGAPAIGAAWASRLAQLGWSGSVLTEADVEQAYLAGLRAIVNSSTAWREAQPACGK